MANRLEVWTNSFQSLADAFEIALDRVDTGSFLSETLTDERRESALIQAFHTLKNFTFYVPGMVFERHRNRPFKVLGLTETDRVSLTGAFWYALKMAQVLEADSLLGGGTSAYETQIEAKRRAGIIQETIGESSMKFQLAPVSESDTMLGSRARTVLAPYLYTAVTIGRA